MAKRKQPSSAPSSPLKNPKLHVHSVALEEGLGRLPSALLYSILFRLDVASICSASASCRFLNSVASQALQLLQPLIWRSLSLTLDLVWRCTRPSISPLRLVHLLKECSALELLSLRFLSQNFEGGELALIPQVVAPSLKELKLGSLHEEAVVRIISNNGNGGTFQNLQRLSLTVLCLISDSLMTVISERLPFLLELELTDDYVPEDEIPEYDDDLSNRGMGKIGNCKKLQRLSIVRSIDSEYSFVRVSDRGFLSMIEQCQCLNWITLRGFSHITDVSCCAILYHCRALKTLKLLDPYQVTDFAFDDLAATPSFLTSVSLSCTLISDYSIRSLAYCCRGLETLNLSSCRGIGDYSLYVISDLVKLKTLVLNGCDVSDFGLVTLGKGKTPLRSIALRGCHRITDNGIAALLEGHIAKTLSSLDLTGISKLTDDTTLTLVHGGLHLVKLRLSSYWRQSYYCIGINASLE